jgi:hypothetical protein
VDFVDGSDAASEELLSHFARHTVCVVCEDQRPGDPATSETFVFSAFLMSVRKFCFLVSAGHVVDDINSRLKSGRQFLSAKIVDGWNKGAHNQSPIPFSYLIDTPQHHVHDDEKGLDWAWFALRPNTYELLRANGMVPLGEHAWKNVPEHLEEFYALGFPNDNYMAVVDAFGNHVSVRVAPRIIRYEQDMNPPSKLVLPIPRLYFTLPFKRNGSFAQVDGMSGGPIFGCRRDENGLQYWLVAIQSSQAIEHPIAIGFPTILLGIVLESALQSKYGSSN